MMEEEEEGIELAVACAVPPCTCARPLMGRLYCSQRNETVPQRFVSAVAMRYMAARP